MEKIYPTKDNKEDGKKSCLLLQAWKTFDRILNTINQCLIVLVTFYVLWLAFNYEKISILEIHIALCTLGYQFMMAEAILTLSDSNLWSAPFSRKIRKYIHLVMAVMGFIFAVTGTALIICDRSRHFKSVHSQLGLAALIFLVPTALNGPIAFISGCFNIKVKPVFMKMYHTITASFAFCLGIGCLCMGFKKNWFKKQTSPEFVTCFIIISSITAILTMKTPIINFIKVIVGLRKR